MRDPLAVANFLVFTFARSYKLQQETQLSLTNLAARLKYGFLVC